MDLLYEISGKPLTLPMVVKIAKDIQTNAIPKKAKIFQIADIVNEVCLYFRISKIEILNNTRLREIVEKRQIAMYLAYLYTKKSYRQIGLEIGGKDRATVLYANKVVSNLIETNKIFAQNIEKLSIIINFKR